MELACGTCYARMKLVLKKSNISIILIYILFIPPVTHAKTGSDVSSAFYISQWQNFLKDNTLFGPYEDWMNMA